jgi:copper chaperone CopZ
MKKFLIIVVAIGMTLASCGNQEKESTIDSEKQAVVNPENVVLIDMDVNGMTCTGCENTIKTGVSELEGVVSVKASHTDAKTYVEVDTSLTKVDEISQVIVSKGYEVTGSKIEKN